MLSLDSNLLSCICIYLNDSDILCLILTCSDITKRINKETLWLNRIIFLYNDEIGPIEQIRFYKPNTSWKSYYKEIKQYLRIEENVFKSYNRNISEIFRNNRLDLVKLLINRKKILPSEKIRIDNKYLTILEIACTYGYLDMAKYILEKDIDPTVNNNSVIGIASDKGYLDIVKLLLNWERNEEIIDPRSNMNYAFAYGCRNGYIDVVKFLLGWKGPNDEYIDPRLINNTPYAFAKMSKQHEIIEILLDWRGPNNEQVKPIYNKELITWPYLVTYLCPYS